MSRLFRQDRLIAGNALRTTFSGWHDRVIIMLMLAASLAFLHAWLMEQRWMIAAWSASAAGAMIGFRSDQLMTARLAFHVFDGLLAADALQPVSRRSYSAAWHGVGLVILIAITLVGRPSLLIVSIPAYLFGVFVATLMRKLNRPRPIVRATRLGLSLRAWGHHPFAGLLSAAVLLLSLLPARASGTNTLMAAACIGTALFGLMLTNLNHSVVRFMTLSGSGSRRIMWHHIRGAASFLIVAIPGCAIMIAPIASVVVACTGSAAMLLLATRILAYRLHDKRFADFLVSILAALVALAAYSAPIALPLILCAMLWNLQRRARTHTWLLV